MALLLLGAISTVHTDDCVNQIHHGFWIASATADHCVACEILAGGTGTATFTSVYAPMARFAVVFVIDSTIPAPICADILSSSSRAPPVA